jgi:nucleotide-binding universal stress UspA family protein
VSAVSRGRTEDVNESGCFGEKILVGVDGSSNAGAALAWAVDEARARGASVEALYVWQEPTMAYGAPGYVPLTRSEIEAQGESIVSDALANVPAVDDVKVHRRITSGMPAEVLTWAAAEPDVTLLVVGTRGRGGLAGLLLGSVSRAVAHHCPKPLVIVPAGWTRDGAEAVRKVVVGVDGSPESERALTWAIHEGMVRHAPVEAVMVWSTPSPVLPAHIPVGALAATGDDAKVTARLRETVDRIATPGDQVECVVLSGHPAQRLVERACDAQLLVLGTRGLGWVREAISGSVSHACAHHAPVPVVVVPKADAS